MSCEVAIAVYLIVGFAFCLGVHLVPSSDYGFSMSESTLGMRWAVMLFWPFWMLVMLFVFAYGVIIKREWLRFIAMMLIVWPIRFVCDPIGVSHSLITSSPLPREWQ